mmetsp:Transcript_7428/g.10628  ORF Transcript_7428/g.10628 Transcript_7428/m.10628 type:complete len:290 (-) Transcript_7428:68-937(-)
MKSMIQSGQKPDMVVLSPGPGNPSDFELSKTINFLIENEIPGFGVCLGLQGMVEHFGGTLGVLEYPMHGKPSPVHLTTEGEKERSLFNGIPNRFEVARYHSLHGIKDKMPSCLDITALTDDDIVMGIQHKVLPFAAVQFHPESILTSPFHGMKILENALKYLSYESKTVDVEAKDQNKFVNDSENDLCEDSEVFDENLEVAADFEVMSVAELKQRLKNLGLSSTGSKGNLIVKLTLWTHKCHEANNGNLGLDSMTVAQLRELKQGLGLKGTAPNKEQLLKSLKECLGIV